MAVTTEQHRTTESYPPTVLEFRSLRLRCQLGSDSKESTCNAGELGQISGLGRSPGGGHGNPLQYSCLEDPMDRGAWRATDHRVAKSRTRLKCLSTQAHSSTLNSPQHGYWCCRHSPGCFLATRGVGAPFWWDIHMFSLGIHVCSGLSLGWPLGRKEGTGLCGSVTTLPEKRKGLFTYRLSWNSPLELQKMLSLGQGLNERVQR